MKVIDYKKFHLSKLVYEKPIKIKGGCLMTKTKYRVNGQDIPIYIQSPKLKTISGLVLNETRSYIDLELDKNHLGFYEFITNIDESNINTTHKNSDEWFGQSLPMDVIDDFYNSPIKMNKIDKAPNVKFKIPVSKNRPLCEIFGDNSRPLNHEIIVKNIDVICILELVGIKYFKQRFECEWQVLQMRAFPDNYVPKACMIDETLMTDFEKEPELFTLNKNVESSTLEKANAAESNVTEANVAESNISEAIVTESNVAESNVAESNVAEAIVTESNVAEAIVTESNVVEANVVEANVAEANVAEDNEEDNEEDVNLEDVNLEDVNLEDINNLESIEQNLDSDNVETIDLTGNNLNIEDLNIDDELDNDINADEYLEVDTESDFTLTDESDEETDLESDDISDLDENIEEIYLDNDESESEEESEEEDEIDLDLEEVELENNNSSEVHNLMNEIEELKNIAIEKDNEVNQLKEMNLQAM
jgi:uncharacterized protein YjbI with pentapeptide repeats